MNDISNLYNFNKNILLTEKLDIYQIQYENRYLSNTKWK
jgi:hypothetical protein